MKTLAWAFARNPVFANIVLVLIFLLGYIAARSMTRETFPDFQGGQIQVTVPYPGADPSEVEEGVALKIEEALVGLSGVRRLTTDSHEGVCQALIDVEESADFRQVLDQVRLRLDGISAFPADAEAPIVTDRVYRDLVVLVALSADLPERRLKHWAEDLKDEILALPEVSQVTLAGAREFEISVEVSEERLQAHGMTLAELSNVIRGSSQSLPAGTIRTGGEEVRLRTLGRKYTGEELGDIAVRALPTGAIIPLDRIAEIRDGFAEDSFVATLDGAPAVFLLVSKTRDEDSIEITDAIRELVSAKQSMLPPGARIELMYDMSSYLRARINLLLKNGVAGLVVVFLLIWAFLDLRLSFWVALGMPISIAGGLAVMWAMGESINMISLFALIMVLGLVVDDAIVVGEAIYQRRMQGMSAIEAAVEGLGDVGWPVLAGVTTTIVAFLPLAFVSGVMGKFISSLPVVVIGCLIVSLVEVLLLFPAHLGHARIAEGPASASSVPFVRRFRRAREGLQRGLDWLIREVYAPTLERAFAWRYAVMAGMLAACLIMAGIVAGGYIRFELFGKVDGSILTSRVELPGGTPLHVTEAVVQRMEQAIREVSDRIPTRSGEPLLQHVLALSGGSLDTSGQYGPHIGSTQVVLLDSKSRGIHSDRVMVEWEKAIGPIAGAEALSFENIERGPVAHAIEIWLRGPDLDALLESSEGLRRRLGRFSGVYQVEGSFRTGKQEIRFELKPEASALGLTVADLAGQLQARFFGREAIRIQRGKDEIRVKVRYPAEERTRLSTLDGVRIRTPLGGDVPLYSVAEAEEAPGYASIRRIDGMRAVLVTAKVDSDVANAREVLAELQHEYIPRLEAEYPGVLVTVRGESEAMQLAMDDLMAGFPLAIVGIYVLIAAIFRSYIQPVVILFTIPLGAFGALLSHLLLGMDITLLSVFGMVALAGVAVNDAIVMIEAVNKNLAEGMPFHAAVREGGLQRFRAVLLTTVTTVGGLAPLILETDFQAKFLIPMAVSIAGGELLGTLFTVIVVPVFLYIMNDFRCLAFRVVKGRWPEREDVEPAVHREVDAGSPMPVLGGFSGAGPSPKGASDS